ncbi:glycoside hydrolase family 1 protein [Lactobacillus amylovorus]|uniref:glycoside hydrolase family 1 protein n=1 Tax=Lactobacillus amylovorus TaxID=1604 RepID=UPI0022E12A4B|nr:glycoside hydrolase family 1 protein [Lactobacillus amylovorus]
MNEQFLWGGSTSAFQFEGGGHEGGKGPSIYDQREKATGIKYSVASDFYHHYHDDIKLMKEMDFNSFRMSIAWTRIFPNGIEDRPNMEGIRFYQNVFKELKENGIEPVVTLFHWDMPQYLVDHYDGFYSPIIVKYFSKYVKTCFEYFGEYVKYWLTLNENNLSLLIPWMYFKDKNKIPKEKREQVKWECYKNSVLCHFKAVSLCHEMLPNAKIGNMIASAYAYPLTPKPDDVFATQKHNQETMWNDLTWLTTGKIPLEFRNYLAKKRVNYALTDDEQKICDASDNKIDFISFSYYFSLCMKSENNQKDTNAETIQMLYKAYYNPYLKRTSFGWQIDPLGLRIFLNELYSRYHLPMMIVENGCGVTDEKITSDHKVHDTYRIDYLKKHIHAVMEARNKDDLPVLGYLPWGCIDLFSASGDYHKRYGFVYVDFEHNLERYKKDSFYRYKKVIASDGKDIE